MGLAIVLSWKLYCKSCPSLVWSIGSNATVATSLLVAAWWSNHQQSEALAAMQPDCVVRFSFWHSLGIKGEEFQFDLHLMAFKDGQLFGWSYREMKLYVVPPDSAINNGTLAYCQQLRGNT